ncbi:hypothetical protein AAVH_10287 [Aphelenchoides avenae]|nr:hypothetical protein AAVH_10287 [Aphelenchus avenae]
MGASLRTRHHHHYEPEDEMLDDDLYYQYQEYPYNDLYGYYLQPEQVEQQTYRTPGVLKRSFSV